MAGSVSSLARYCLFSSTHSVKVIFAIYEKALHYCLKGCAQEIGVFPFRIQYLLLYNSMYHSWSVNFSILTVCGHIQ